MASLIDLIEVTVLRYIETKRNYKILKCSNIT